MLLRALTSAAGRFSLAPVSLVLEWLLLHRGGPPLPPALALALGGGGAQAAWAVAGAGGFADGEGGGEDEAADEEGAGEGAAGGGGLLGRLLPGAARGGGGGLLEALTGHIWMAVPKRKTSYSRKRQRQMNPLYARSNLLNFYPCPKCEKGFLKLRHHLCPCDQEKAHISGVKRVRVRGAGRRGAGGRAGPACHFCAALTLVSFLPFPCHYAQVTYGEEGESGGSAGGGGGDKPQ